MENRNSELSNVSVLSISGAIALVGLVTYMLLMPVSSNERIAVAFATLNQPITR
jgi:uncharacterized membrane protein YjjB (DUF3815 family)